MVGINDYRHFPKLKNCVNDARSIRDFLLSEGVQVYYVENCNKNKYDEIEKEFLACIKPGDAAFVFFACHGCEYNNVNRLLTISTSEKPDLRRDGVNLLALLARWVPYYICPTCMTHDKPPFAESPKRSPASLLPLWIAVAPLSTTSHVAEL